jgi:membrane protease YdiL (CAAX protease family)
MLVSSYIISSIGLKENANQEANIELLRSFPLIEALSAIVFAPIVEELVFRKGFKKALNNKHLFAIATGLLFGLVHVTSSIQTASDLIMLIYLIPYSSLGIAFGYLYYETDNIYSSLFVHSLHNAIIILELIIIMLVGG